MSDKVIGTNVLHVGGKAYKISLWLPSKMENQSGKNK